MSRAAFRFMLLVWRLPNLMKDWPVLQTRSTEMLTNFRVGDRVEDKETHRRGYVTFVYSELEFKGEVIAVLFDGRAEALAVPIDSVRKVSRRQ
jgi:hypothetical protein